ncbi:MAG: GNAT family N-acetyltransferase [Candidatus Pacebacteria bacterium]|nr:GNAT family N-acetyltransferase [Candidatus Paceibacterota bacterium]
MKIINFDEKYFPQMGELFVDVFSESEAIWDAATAISYLRQNTSQSAGYCFVAVDDRDRCLGGIFCRPMPYYQGVLLFVDCVQVRKDFRCQGVATALLQRAVQEAKKNGLEGIQLLADARQNFPQSWYRRLGFKRTGWEEYEVKIKNLKLARKENGGN